MMKTLCENIAYWLEGFDGAGNTFLFLVAALWLRLLLVVVDVGVPGG
jgi:hypothetical protein